MPRLPSDGSHDVDIICPYKLDLPTPRLAGGRNLNRRRSRPALGSGHARPTIGPWALRFQLCGQPENRFLLVRSADDLHGEREAFSGEAGGDRGRRLTGDVPEDGDRDSA